jgi:diguanylate cyclase (GGDEF)-like protein/PAS domain S-box-containing protein
LATFSALKGPYIDLLKNYGKIPVEQHQSALADLARGLLKARASPQDLVQFHHNVCTDMSGKTPGEAGPDQAYGQSEPLFDLLAAYSQALYEAETRHRAFPSTPFHEVIIEKAYQRGPLAILISRIRDDRILEVNESFLLLIGYSREEIVGRTTLELEILVDQEERKHTGTLVQTDDRPRDFETTLRTKTGELCDVLTTVEAIEYAGETCFLRMAYDITERKRTQESLLQEAYHNAFHDELTGLPNRALLMDRLDRALERAKRHSDYAFAILFLDIDQFKDVNDKFGHAIGDQFLTAIAKRLAASLHTRDTVARLGGDEFSVLLDDIRNPIDALKAAEQIQAQLRSPFQIESHEISTSASIGISLSASGYHSPDAMLSDADKAMYRAKAHGRARHEVFDVATHTRAMARMEMKSDLKRAIDERGFQVHYQPIISLETGEIIQFEALGRWLHPSRGLVSPTEFLPVAEETGLIIDIGRWMLREASSQIQRWQAKFPGDQPLELSVNLSIREFFQPDLLAETKMILTETALAAHYLSLEITEGVLMEDPELCAETLTALRELGVKVHIDDFGTGHSSLSLMYSFPINALKIARSFIHRMGPQGENAEIVRTIVMLARDYGMQVIAEGVETSEQLALLRALKCPYAQGYYFSKPMKAESIESLLAEAPRW